MNWFLYDRDPCQERDIRLMMIFETNSVHQIPNSNWKLQEMSIAPASNTKY